jgi:hypothetical protein
MTIIKALPDNKNKIYGGAWSVHDVELIQKRDQALQNFSSVDLGSKKQVQDIKAEFFETYRQWMFADFDFPGTELYTQCCYTQGTTESFAQFYLRYGRVRRLRLAKGEYFYHQMMKNLWYGDSFAWLDDDDIREGDAVLISVPFSDTGMVPDYLEDMLCECDKHQVPVMLDLAYINLTSKEFLNHTIDLTHDCIEYVVSSLSKAFPVEHYRVGIRLQKTMFEDQLYVINEDNYNYLNFCSMSIALEMLKQFTASYMISKYKTQQRELCRQLNVDPSPCYIFGIDTQNQYPQYARGNNTNRLCFSRIWDGRDNREGLEK